MSEINAGQEIGCRFCLEGTRCNQQIDRSSHCFCFKHKDYFADLKNRELLEMAAKVLCKVYVVSSNRTVEKTKDRSILGEMDTLFFELEARGYSPQQSVAAITSLQELLGLNEDLDRAIWRDKKWRKFEKVVAGIHKFAEIGARVVQDDFIIGKNSKRKRQIDVSVRFKQGLYEYLLIVECKRHKRRVSISEIEAFRTKMEDVGANRAVMVSESGFQMGAIPIARTYNIELRTLQENVSDWTSVVKREATTFPFFAGAEFDHDPLEFGLVKEWQPITYEAIVFHRTDVGNGPVKFTDLILNIASQIHKRAERLPALVTVPFSPPWHVLFPYGNGPFEVRSVKLKFEPYVVRSERTIDMPPMVSKYIYSDVIQNVQQEVPAHAIPYGLKTVLEKGKYYRKSLDGYFKCLDIDGNNVTWLEMAVRYDERGQAFHREFIENSKYACYYVPVSLPLEIRNLERLYARLKQYEILHPTRGRARSAGGQV